MGMLSYKCRGRGEAIVFLHGVGGGAESWDAQLRVFGDTHRALAWDMPGYGGSPALDAPDFNEWAEALADWLDDVEVEQCVLVGHSIGGMIAQTFMTRHARRVKRLVMSATSPAFGNPDGEFQRKFVQSRIGPLDEGVSMAELAARFVPELVGKLASDAARRHAIAAMSRVPPEAYRSAMQALVTFDQRPSLGEISAPCLLISGEDDTSAPPRVMERMAQKIPGAELVLVPGMGHLGNIEKPETYNEILAGFLNGAPEKTRTVAGQSAD